MVGAPLNPQAPAPYTACRSRAYGLGAVTVELDRSFGSRGEKASDARTVRREREESALSPVLLIVLAALWAAVLIPATLNSRTAAHDDRTINGFSTAMRTLSRRSATATADSRRVLVPTLSVTDERRKARRDRLRRRRVVLSRVLWTAVGTATLAVVLGGPWVPIHLAVDAAVVVVLVWLRKAAVEEERTARLERRAAAAERERAEHAAYLAARDERMRQRGEIARLASAPRETRRRAVGD